MFRCADVLLGAGIVAVVRGWMCAELKTQSRDFQAVNCAKLMDRAAR
jgi:hypothetical protein